MKTQKQFFLKSFLLFLFTLVLFGCSNLMQLQDEESIEVDLAPVIKQLHTNKSRAVTPAEENPGFSYIRVEFISKKFPQLNRAPEIIKTSSTNLKIYVGKVKKNRLFDLTMIVDTGIASENVDRITGKTTITNFQSINTYKGDISTWVKRYKNFVNINLYPCIRYEVGDIVFKDGSKLSNGDWFGLYAEGWGTDVDNAETAKNNAIAVIFRPGLQGQALGIGKKVGNFFTWANNDKSGYNQKIQNLAATFTRTDSGYQVTGNKDSKNSLSKLLSEITEQYNLNDNNSKKFFLSDYPIFYFARFYSQYATNIDYTPYKDGWYLPSVYEAKEILDNWTKVNESMTSILDSASDYLSGYFWTCAQDGRPMTGDGSSTDSMAIAFGINQESNNTEFTYTNKNESINVLAIHEF